MPVQVTRQMSHPRDGPGDSAAGAEWSCLGKLSGSSTCATPSAGRTALACKAAALGLMMTCTSQLRPGLQNLTF